MAHRYSLLLLAFVLSLLSACGDPKAQPVPIAVVFDPAAPPPATMNTGAYAAIAADVSNDPAFKGVTFTCTPTGACGSFTPTTAGSGVPVCYLAPATVPAGGTTTVTATSVSDPTKSKSAAINILSGLPNPCP